MYSNKYLNRAVVPQFNIYQIFCNIQVIKIIFAKKIGLTGSNFWNIDNCKPWNRSKQHKLLDYFSNIFEGGSPDPECDYRVIPLQQVLDPPLTISKYYFALLS